jgi:hypothetical protein
MRVLIHEMKIIPAHTHTALPFKKFRKMFNATRRDALVFDTRHLEAVTSRYTALVHLSIAVRRSAQCVRIITAWYVLPTQCIYVFCVDLSTNSDYFSVQH